MTVTRGKKHTFLGMDITFTDEGTAEISTLRQYLEEEAIAESGLTIKRTPKTPARKDLFDVNNAAKRISGDRAERFHNVVCKLLHVAIRARMDILLPVAWFPLHARIKKHRTRRVETEAFVGVHQRDTRIEIYPWSQQFAKATGIG